ncbi:MAG: retropepsin-like aspartic protease family protein, partial [Methyloligellaceae bacterium]
ALSSGIRQAAREGVLWLSLFCAGFAGFYYFDEFSGFVGVIKSIGDDAYNQSATETEQPFENGFAREVTLTAGRNGHFYSTAYIDGTSIQVLVDTGASFVSLTYEDARKIGLRLTKHDYIMRMRTANGSTRAAPVVLDSVRIGDITVRNVKASVGLPGAKHVTLLGMTFLSKLKSVDLRGRQLVLTD